MCIRYRGKLRQHKLIRVQCTKKSTRVPVSPVPSTGIRFKKVKIIKTYNPYTKILNFVLLIWEERNSGRYEHARACRERVRAPRAREKTHQPSNDTISIALLATARCLGRTTTQVLVLRPVRSTYVLEYRHIRASWGASSQGPEFEH